jgi:hypothetical protein
MPAGLRDEDDGSGTLDLHGGGVQELDGASHGGVHVGEVLTSPGHVVGGTGVEVPSVDLFVARTLPKEGVSSRLVEVEERSDGRHRRGAYLDTPVHQEQGRLVVDSSLHDVSQTAALRPYAVLGPMASPSTVVAGIIAGGLALAVGGATGAVTRTRSLALLAWSTCAAPRRA